MLNVKCKDIKILEENIAEILCEIGLGNESLDIRAKTWSVKEKLIKWTSLKLTTFSLWRHC